MSESCGLVASDSTLCNDPHLIFGKQDSADEKFMGTMPNGKERERLNQIKSQISIQGQDHQIK